MKSLVKFLIVLLCMVFSGQVLAQNRSPQTFTRIRDASNTDWQANVRQFDLTLSTSLRGVLANAGVYFYDGANLRRWLGAQMDSDAVAETTYAPWVGNFNMVYDETNGDWARWTSDALNSDSVATTSEAPRVGSFLHGYHNVDGLWERLILIDPADGIALTNHGVMTTSAMLGYNGATLDMLRVGAVGELEMTDVAVRPGEDSGNDWRKVKKEETGVYAPAKTAGTAVDDSAGGDLGDEVLSSTYILDLPNVCVWIKNAGGGSGDALLTSYVLVSPSGSSGEWESIDWTDCDLLASGGGVCSVCFSNQAYVYVKAEAICDTGDDTTVDAWISANKN